MEIIIGQSRDVRWLATPPCSQEHKFWCRITSEKGTPPSLSPSDPSAYGAREESRNPSAYDFVHVTPIFLLRFYSFIFVSSLYLPQLIYVIYFFRAALARSLLHTICVRSSGSYVTISDLQFSKETPLALEM